MAVDDQRDGGLDELSGPEDSVIPTPEVAELNEPSGEVTQDTVQFDDDALAAALEQQFGLTPIVPAPVLDDAPPADSDPEPYLDLEPQPDAAQAQDLEPTADATPEPTADATPEVAADPTPEPTDDDVDADGETVDAADSVANEQSTADEGTDADHIAPDGVDTADDAHEVTPAGADAGAGGGTEPHDELAPEPTPGAASDLELDTLVDGPDGPDERVGSAAQSDPDAHVDAAPFLETPEHEPVVTPELVATPEPSATPDPSAEPHAEGAGDYEDVDPDSESDQPKTQVLERVPEPETETALFPTINADADADAAVDEVDEEPDDDQDDEPEFDIFKAFDDTAPTPTMVAQARPTAPVVPPAPVIPTFAPVLDFDAIVAGSPALKPTARPVTAASSSAPSAPAADPAPESPAWPTPAPAPIRRPLASTPLINPAPSAPPRNPPTAPIPVAGGEPSAFEELFGFAEPRTAGIPQQPTASHLVGATVVADAGTAQTHAVSTERDERGGGGAGTFWLWFAANSSVLSVVFGAAVFSLGMSLRQAIVAVLAGITLSFLPLALTTIAGARSATPAVTHSRAVFGVVGAVAPAALILVGRVLWGIILFWLLATTVRGLLRAQSADAATVSTAAPDGMTLAVGVGGLIVALAIAAAGIRAIATFQLIVSVLSAVLVAGFIGITASTVDLATALTVPDAEWIMVVTGAILVFSVCGLLWAGSTTDIASQRGAGGSSASAAIWTTAGVTLPSFILIAYGAILAASDPELATALSANPFTALASLVPVWYAIPLLAAAALGLLSGLVLVLHSTGLTIQAVGWMPRVVAVLASAVLIGALGSVALGVSDFAGSARDFITSIAVPVAAWAGIVSADTLLRNRPLDRAALARRGGVYADVRWGNLAVLVVASLIGFGLTTAAAAGLSWQGYLLPAIGFGRDDVVGASDLGVLAALVIGLVVPLISSVAGVRQQEQSSPVAR